MNRDTLIPFTRAYIAAMFFTTTDNSDDSGGDPLDDNYSIEDIDSETLASIIEDCAKFVEVNSKHFEDADDEQCSDGVWTAEQSAGLDYWMTRNGHGTGFWESSRQEKYGKENAQAMDEYSKKSSGIDIYVGDDGKLYGN